MSGVLAVMRLADMARVHERQDNSRVCARCGEQVGIYPSGQAALIQDPSIEIVCSVCIYPSGFAVAAPPSPEIVEEVRQSIPRRRQ